MDMISEHCREPVTSKAAKQWFESTKELRASGQGCAVLREGGGVKRALPLFLVWLLAVGAVAATGLTFLDDYAGKVSNLIDPAKLATLRARGANPRVQKYVALLTEAQDHGIAPKKVAGRAVAMVGMKGQLGKLTAKAMVRNVVIAERLACLDADGLRRMLAFGREANKKSDFPPEAALLSTVFLHPMMNLNEGTQSSTHCTYARKAYVANGVKS